MQLAALLKLLHNFPSDLTPRTHELCLSSWSDPPINLCRVCFLQGHRGHGAHPLRGSAAAGAALAGGHPRGKAGSGDGPAGCRRLFGL